MREYRVETEHVIKNYGVIIVSAEDEIQALEKARSCAKDGFLETESVETNQWQVKKRAGFFDFLSFLIGK